jgi:glycosyltransferase A (GT-A) superfamily protein (DUF2064 family)
MELTVAVIAKECLPGRVKTRMSPPLTPAQASGIAQLSLSRTLKTVRHWPVSERVLVMEGTPLARDAAGFRLLPQAGGSLDERLAAICDSIASPLLIIGMDTPQVSASRLAPLFTDWASAGSKHDAWLGPASDGGFWALALRRPRGSLIRGVRMSRDTTGAEQLARLASEGLSTRLLPVLRDMDSFEDAVEIAAVIPGTDFAASVRAALMQQQTYTEQRPAGASR